MGSNHRFRPWSGGLAALMVCVAAPVAAQGDALTAFAAPPTWRVMSAERLAEVRGGFEMPQLQLRLSFGLEQSVLVNGELVARTVLNIEQLRQSVAERVNATRTTMIDSAAALNSQIQAQVAAQLQSVGLRTTTINTVSPAQAQAEAASAAALAQAPVNAAPVAAATPASVAPVVSDAPVGAPSVSQPMVATETVATPTSTASSGAPAQTATSVQVVSPVQDAPTVATVPVTVVQSGAGNVVSSASVVGNDAMTTIIQNTLDGQRIQVLTEVSASANSLQVLRAMNLNAAIREGVINSLRR